MAPVTVIIFDQPIGQHEGELTAFLRRAREVISRRHGALFERLGARVVQDVPSPGSTAGWGSGSFRDRLMAHVSALHGRRAGLVLLGSGAVPLLRRGDATALLDAAVMPGRRALTNNLFSSDVCALSDASALLQVPPMMSDNALPRWLSEEAGFEVRESRARSRLAMDVDSPLDVALLALGHDGPPGLARLADEAGVRVPRLEELRAVAADPGAQLLVAGRSGSGTLRWLEKGTRCRVRFLSEERGLRAGTAMAGGPGVRGTSRPPCSVLGRLLELRGPGRLAETLAELADAAVVDSRVLLADRLGADEAAWPSAEDRFASDLLRVDRIEDAWLAELTASAARAPMPVLLGAHTLVGPGIPRLLARPDSGAGPSGRGIVASLG